MMARKRSKTRSQDCGKAEGERSRSDDHHDAVKLVKQVAPGGDDAGSKLLRLLSLKDESQYGFAG